MNQELKTAIIQCPLAWEDPEANRVYFTKKINDIDEKADVIILPEMFTTGFTMNATSNAETMQGQTIIWMQDLAYKKQAAITGSIIIEENNCYYNRLLFVTPQGTIKTYDKKHLFTLANEQKTYTPGTEKLIVDYKGWKICPMICYDLRFPVWSRNVEDYDVLIYVANWPKSRIRAWDVLLQARAIENMSYCIGVNRTGLDGKDFEYVGHSAIYDGLGKLISEERFEKEGTFITTLNKTHLYKARRKFRFLNDRDSFKVL